MLVDANSQRIKDRDRLTIDGDDLVILHHTGLLSGALLIDRSNQHSLIVEDRLAADQEDADHDDDRQQVVHERSGNDHGGALPNGLRHELFGGTGLRIIRILADHLHKAAKRDYPDTVSRLPPLLREDVWREAERELLNLDADLFGHQEVP